MTSLQACRWGLTEGHVYLLLRYVMLWHSHGRKMKTYEPEWRPIQHLWNILHSILIAYIPKQVAECSRTIPWNSNEILKYKKKNHNGNACWILYITYIVSCLKMLTLSNWTSKNNIFKIHRHGYRLKNCYNPNLEKQNHPAHPVSRMSAYLVSVVCKNWEHWARCIRQLTAYQWRRIIQLILLAWHKSFNLIAWYKV